MRIVALLLLLAGVVVQDPDEYPPGHVCVRVADVKGPTTHPCSCQRTCVPSEDADGHQTIAVQEDPQCAQYCHPKSCACPVKDCE
jgi:hypothetical protein